MAGYRWLLAAVLLAPLAVLPPEFGVGIPQAKNAVFILLGLSVVLWLIPSWWVRGFLAWAVVSFAASGMRGWGLAALVGLFAWSLCYMQASRLTAPQWATIRLAITLAAMLQLAWMGVQWAGVDPIFAPIDIGGNRMSGPGPILGWFANPMDTALFLGLCLPAVVGVSRWGVPLVAIPLLWFLRATVGVLAVGVIVVWLAWQQSTRLALLALLGAGLLVASYVTWVDPLGSGGGGVKPTLWQNGWHLIRQSPLVGWGPNAIGYRLVLVDQTNHRWEFLFSDWIQGGVELGLVGISLATGYFGSLVWRLRRRWKQAGELVPALVLLVGLAAISIPFRIGPAALLGALYLGRLEGWLQESKA